MRQTYGFSLILLLIATYLLATPSSPYAQTCTYVDPRVDWNGYKQWCACKGGTPYNDARGVGCDVRRSSSNQSFAPNFVPQTRQQFGLWAFGVGLNAFMQGMQRGMEQNRIRQHQMAYARRRQLEQQRRERKNEIEEEIRRRRAALNLEQRQIDQQMEERRKREDAQHREFEKSKKRILGALRTSGTDGETSVRSTLGTLQIKEGALTRVGLDYRRVNEPGTMDAEEKNECARILLASAGTAVNSVNIATDATTAAANMKEAGYLSGQAKHLLGGSERIEVQCAAAPEMEGRPVVEDKALNKRAEDANKVLLQQATFYEFILADVARQIEAYGKVRASVEQAEEEVAKAKERHEDAQRKLERVKKAAEETPKKGAPRREEQADGKDVIVILEKSESDPALKRVLLEETQAEKQLQELEALLGKEKKKMDELKKSIKESNTLVEKFNTDPNAREKIMQDIKDRDAAASENRG